MALDFYNKVRLLEQDPREANITTKGHSLGDGLAGLVANVYHQNAVLYDHMAYGPVSLTLSAIAQIQTGMPAS